MTRTCPAQSLDGLLQENVSGQIAKQLRGMSNLSQIAQIVINLEHFNTACDELEAVLMNLRYTIRRSSLHCANRGSGRRKEVDQCIYRRGGLSPRL